MGINLSLSCAFKPRQEPSQEALDELAETMCYSDIGIRDDGHVYINGSDVGDSDAVDEFIREYAEDYVIVEGDCDDGHFEDLVCPPHICETDAQIRWRRSQIATLEKEIRALGGAAHWEQQETT